MQLLILSDTLAGGMGALARTHAAWFAARDWDVTLVAPADGTLPTAPVRFVEIPAVSSLRRITEMRAARTALRRIWRDLDDDKTVLHVHGMRSFLVCRLAGLPKPFVSMHGNHPADDDPRGYQRLRHFGFALLPRLARGATSGEPTSVRGWTYYPFASPLLARVGVLPFPPADSEPVIAWLGLLDDRKQPELFVRAIARVAADGAVLRGVMGGTGPRLDEIKALATSLDAPVDLLGQTDAVALLERSWALVLFSQSEGTPLSVMEAMWTGRSVIASPLPGNVYLIGDTGALATTVDEAAAAIRTLVTDHALAAGRGEAAARRVRTLLTADTPWAELDASYRA